MYRKEPPAKKYNIILHHGGLGDAIGQLPAIKYILDEHPQVIMDLWIHDYFIPIATKVFHDYPQCNIFPVSKYKEYKLGITRSPYIHTLSNLSMHITDHAFITIVGTQVEDKHKNYIQLKPVDTSKFKLPENYAIITTGFTSQTREWKPEYIKEVTDYLVTKGITPVYLGKAQNSTGTKHIVTSEFNADLSNGIDLLDKTTILEAHGLISKAKLVIGLDNGLMHLAGMTETPSIWGFTTVEPRHRLPYRNGKLGDKCFVVTPKNLDCFGCQSNWNFADTTVDFRFCPYKDYKCVDEIKPELWIEQIDKALNRELTPKERAEEAYQDTLRMTELNRRIKEILK